MGNCKSIQMRQLLLPALEAVGGQLHLGVFQGTLSPATPLGEVISNDGKPTTFLLGFPADREILFTFFLKEFFFSTRERNNPSLRQMKSWMPLPEQVAEVLFLEGVCFLLEESPALRASKMHQLLCSDLISRGT